MNTKRILIPAVAVVAVVGVGGGFWAVQASDNVKGAERDRVAAVAIESAGGGEAVDVETSDDPGEAYEVEVRKADGTEVDVTLDDNLAVIERDDDRDDRDDDSDDRDRDDRALTAQERTSAGKAALAAVGGGTVVSAEASDDGPVAYEVDVIDAKKVAWDVDLDADYTVLSKHIDD